MSKNIFTLIKTEYEKRQKAAHDSLMARKSEIYFKVPRIEEIDSEIQLSGIKYNKAILLGTSPVDNAVSGLVMRISDLNKEKQLLLASYGFADSYLETVYICPICKDKGFVESSINEECRCYKQELINHLYHQSNLKLVDVENFSCFDEGFYTDKINEQNYGIKKSPRENILGIKERCFKFIENFNSPDEKNLFFSGRTGVGKSFMCSCIAREILDKGKTVLYQTASSLFDTISEYKMKAFKDEEFEVASFKSIFDVELLIIDDLGTETQSPSRYAELLNIINTRQTNNLIRPCKTIISTNIEANKLYEYYTERVASRIIGCFAMFRFAGEDIRSIKRLK